MVFNPFLPDWSPVLRKTPPQVQNLAATQFVLPSVQFVLTPAVLGIPDCAKFLGATPNFIETEMRAGRLAFLFYGGKRVVRISELQRWLDEQEEKSGKLGLHRAPAGVTCTRGRVAGIAQGLNAVKVSVADVRCPSTVPSTSGILWHSFLS